MTKTKAKRHSKWYRRRIKRSYTRRVSCKEMFVASVARAEKLGALLKENFSSELEYFQNKFAIAAGIPVEFFNFPPPGSADRLKAVLQMRSGSDFEKVARIREKVRMVQECVRLRSQQ